MAKLSKAEQELLDSMDKHRELAAGRKKGASKSGGIKKRKGKGKLLGPKRRALDLVEEFGLCPISLQPMRRPVLPSSGQAFDEVNLVRFCSGGKKRCPVSGAVLDFARKGAHKGQVTRTPDYALRNVIRHQAAAAKVYIAPIDKDQLLRELDAVTDLATPGEDHATVMPAVAKAVVDDTYLGYITLGELRDLVAARSASGDGARPSSCAAGVFAELVAECLACRAPEICALGASFLREEGAWRCGRVLQEALSVGQDPDCRGNVLRVMEAKFEKLQYSAEQARAVLTFDTESVPLQQFQARCAEHILTNCYAYGGATLHKVEAEGVLNLALRVRQDLSGCESSGSTGYALWFLALQALKRTGQTLDSASMDRLFARDNRQVLASLAGHPDLLHWHLMKHPSRSLTLCITALADDDVGYEDVNQESMYSDEEEEEFLGSDEDDDMAAFEQQMALPRRMSRSASEAELPVMREGSFHINRNIPSYQNELEEPAHSLSAVF